MAISKAKKETLVADLTALLADAKLTAYARYQGLTVADLQDLRRAAREAGVKIKVVKNRLVRVAMNEIAVYKDTDTTGLTGQLVYAISDTDEVAPAKVLAAFAKTHPALELLGGFNDLGPTLKFGAKYEDYLLGTFFARPCIAKALADIAIAEGADAILKSR